jgi:hypothetical protein
MNNNTQIETVEEVTESLARAFDNDNWKALQSLILDGINWQKQQDEAEIKRLNASYEDSLSMQRCSNAGFVSKINEWEAKYKELLDSHNELLELIKSDSVYNLLRQGVKRPSSTGMDDCDENDYFELYNISTKLRNKQS